jgi:hypothetical protein
MGTDAMLGFINNGKSAAKSVAPRVPTLSLPLRGRAGTALALPPSLHELPEPIFLNQRRSRFQRGRRSGKEVIYSCFNQARDTHLGRGSCALASIPGFFQGIAEDTLQSGRPSIARTIPKGPIRSRNAASPRTLMPGSFQGRYTVSLAQCHRAMPLKSLFLDVADA